MRPATCKPLALTAALLGLAVLAGCEQAATDDRPRAKPETLTASVPASGRQSALSRASISTKSGDILILEPDGSVSKMKLDSPQGRDAFAVSEADLMALNSNLDLNLNGMVAANLPRRKTDQERALEAFARRTQPALPAWDGQTTVEKEAFLGSRVVPLNPDKAADLVEVQANLREGVDADIAFSYATCALAAWAKENGGKYGRHIRTLQDTRNGKLLIGAAFTLSDSKPMGLRVMETKETLQECRARGIPAA